MILKNSECLLLLSLKSQVKKSLLSHLCISSSWNDKMWCILIWLEMKLPICLNAIMKVGFEKFLNVYSFFLKPILQHYISSYMCFCFIYTELQYYIYRLIFQIHSSDGEVCVSWVEILPLFLPSLFAYENQIFIRKD